jgi:hypothetical protein
MTMNSHQQTSKSTGLIAVALLVTATAFAVPAQARQRSDWQAFIGCWTPAEAIEDDLALCFRPAENGVEVTTVLDGAVESVETLIADGAARELTPAEECTESRSLQFSGDRRRIFTESRVTCDTETRTGSGLMTFIAPDRWIDVRSIQVSGEPVSWLQEFRPVDPGWFRTHRIGDPAATSRPGILTMRTRAAEAIGTADVREALENIDARAVAMWVAVQPTAFDLEGSEIIALADAGVPTPVIDVMVAVSYPDRFVLSLDSANMITEAERPRNRPRRPVRAYGVGYRSFLFDPFYNTWIYPYGPYGLYGPDGFYPSYGYLNDGRFYWSGQFSGYSGYIPGNIVVQPQEPPSEGRMVNGQGYNRDRTGGATATPRGTGGSSSPTVSASTVSGGGASGGGGTPSTSSGTSSSPTVSSPARTSTGRTAQPKD